MSSVFGGGGGGGGGMGDFVILKVCLTNNSQLFLFPFLLHLPMIMIRDLQIALVELTTHKCVRSQTKGVSEQIL